MICKEVFTSEDALTHKEETGHNTWELVRQSKMNLYKWLWSRIGKRPWTYIYRDVWHNVEILMQAQWFWTAILILWLLDIDLPIRKLLIYWSIYIFGFIMGHFFWGTKWQAGQEGK